MRADLVSDRLAMAVDQRLAHLPCLVASWKYAGCWGAKSDCLGTRCLETGNDSHLSVIAVSGQTMRGGLECCSTRTWASCKQGETAVTSAIEQEFEVEWRCLVRKMRQSSGESECLHDAMQLQR
jgi:hypothetical protein